MSRLTDDWVTSQPFRRERLGQLLLGPHGAGADELEDLEVALAAVGGHDGPARRSGGRRTAAAGELRMARSNRRRSRALPARARRTRARA